MQGENLKPKMIFFDKGTKIETIKIRSNRVVVKAREKKRISGRG